MYRGVSGSLYYPGNAMFFIRQNVKQLITFSAASVVTVSGFGISTQSWFRAVDTPFISGPLEALLHFKQPFLMICSFALFCASLYFLVETIRRFIKARNRRIKALNRKHLESFMDDADPLTGLPRVQYFNSTLADYHAAFTGSKERFGVLAIEIDNMDTLIAELGEEYRDIIIRKIANYLNAYRRSYDPLCRIDETEFVMIVSDTNMIQLRMIANRYRKSIERLVFKLNGKTLDPTCCVGAVLNVESKSSSDLFGVLEKRLAKAIDGGTNQVVWA